MSPDREELLFELAPVAMLVADEDGLIQGANRRAARLFDATPETLVGRPVEGLLPDSRFAQARDAAGGTADSIVLRGLTAQRRDGSGIAVEADVTALAYDGRPMTLTTLTEVEERREADDLFQAAVEAAPAGMLMVDAQRRIVMCNREVESIFGYESGELIGQMLETLIPENIAAVHPGYVESYLADPEPRSMGMGRELFGRHRSGRLVPVEVGLQPIRSGGQAFVISSVLDISRRKAAETELRHRTEELAEFAYRTSHDLRSPLKSIALATDCIVEDIQSGELDSAVAASGRVQQLSHKLMQLVEDILALTRVDSENEPIAEFDFDDYERTAREKFRADLEGCTHRLKFDCETPQPLRTQPARLTQVLDNLVSNAIKYRDPTKPRFELSVRASICESDPSKMRLEIRDNGRGIPENRQPDMFKMFQRFHESSIPGSGLGLAIIKKQLDRLSGEIRFVSSPAGTTFTLSLPLG